MCFNNCSIVCNYVIRPRRMHNYVNGVLALVDVDIVNPDEKSIMTYVAQFLQYSKNLPESEEDMQVCCGGCNWGIFKWMCFLCLVYIWVSNTFRSSDSAADRTELAWTFWCSCVEKNLHVIDFWLIIRWNCCAGCSVFITCYRGHFQAWLSSWVLWSLCEHGRRGRQICRCTEQPALNSVADMWSGQKLPLQTALTRNPHFLFFIFSYESLVGYSHIPILIISFQQNCSQVFLWCLHISRCQV